MDRAQHKLLPAVYKAWLFGMLVGLCFMLVSAPWTSEAADKAQIIVNGEALQIGVDPVYEGGRLLVPMRPIFEALSAEVEWQQPTGTIVVQKNDRRLTLVLGQRFAWIDEQRVELDLPAKLMNGTTMVPLRFVAEALEAEVKWNEEKRIAVINEFGHDETYSWSQPVETIESGAGEVKESLPSSAEEQTVSIPEEWKTVHEIRARWKEVAPTSEGNPYITKPMITGHFAIGELQERFIADGVAMTNFVRYLADLPDTVRAHADLNEEAQYGAVLLAAHGQLSHEPEPKPRNMPQDFYQKGFEATKHSNLAQYYSRFSGSLSEVPVNMREQRLSPALSVMEYMRDGDIYNMAQVGHRRWILEPSLDRTGFGYADHWGEEDGKAFHNQFSVMRVIHEKRDEKAVDYDYVAWPSKGYFPVEFFPGNDPWSVSLNPEKYAEPVASQVRVTMKQVASGKQWTLDHQDSTISENGEFFTVNTEGYGIPYCIIFRPSDISSFAPGEATEVTITGLKDKQGRERVIQYLVIFFALEP